MSRPALALPGSRLKPRDRPASTHNARERIEGAPLVVLVGRAADERELLRAAARTGAVTLVAPDLQAALLWLGQATRPVTETEADDSVIDLDGLVLDVHSRQARWRGSSLPLTAQDFRLFAALANHPGAVLSFTDLSEMVWGSRHHGDRWMVRSAVQRLRRKLASANVAMKITSIRGIGFRLDRSLPGGKWPEPVDVKRYRRPHPRRIPGRQAIRHSPPSATGDPN